MKVNIIDSAAGLVLVMLLTPRLGVWGYILTVWICEVGNLAASIHKLGKITCLLYTSLVCDNVVVEKVKRKLFYIPH